jgi:hypothetical protein
MSSQSTGDPTDRIELWKPQQTLVRYDCPHCTVSHLSTREHQLSHLEGLHRADRVLKHLTEDLIRLDLNHPAVGADVEEFLLAIASHTCPVCRQSFENERSLHTHVSDHGAGAVYEAVANSLPDSVDKAPRYSGLGYSSPASTALQLLPGDEVTITVSGWTTQPTHVPAPLMSTQPWTLTGRVETIQFDFRDICRPVLGEPFDEPDAGLMDLCCNDLDILRKVYLALDLTGDDNLTLDPWTLTVDAPPEAPAAIPNTSPPRLTLKHGVVTGGTVYPDPDVKIVDATIESITRTPWTADAP